MADISPEGDAARQAEIDALPESLKLTLEDGTEVDVPYRAFAQAQDDDWRRFRDSPFYSAMMDDWNKINDAETGPDDQG